MKLEEAITELANVSARIEVKADRTGQMIDRMSKNIEEALERLSHDDRHTSPQSGRRRPHVGDEVRAAEDDSSRWYGELANKMGWLVDLIVAPGMPDLFRERFRLEGPVSFAENPRYGRGVGAFRTLQFDYVAWAGDLVLVNQAWSTLRSEYMAEFLDALQEIRDYVPQAEGRQVIGCVAVFSFDPSLVRAGEEQGLLMVGLDTGRLRVLNSPGFEPRRF